MAQPEQLTWSKEKGQRTIGLGMGFRHFPVTAISG
jgi:hypothetical protein